ncbi:hypothetical protein CABS01_11545 [Colletotrichum abscissum]|uniref:Uncharacterized protein n=1 Tax=Colletotrichum abscissum TaxID=1671311 RepID=A0A9P9XJX1_9PEZI|nr:uncharacterized protein CABS01_11545 [Colletotrichum abscissum]KAI3555046.1 hypothetical protein CABS02_04885 [Colletotrichum abscissum]KAK1493376.1 hypothetical protein CABS01_11545 [Colletotrichum abscissum]
MATDGSDCPETSNSTDCLLRNLLQLLNNQRDANDAEVNWDPISFAFTLILGLAAALFAAITIWQAIATAGKGWRKTNPNAIGGWAARTETRWVWTEMSYKTTAWTPILNVETVKHWAELGDLPAADGKEKSAWERMTDFLRKSRSPTCKVLNRDPNTEDRPAATWVRLLEELGLEEIKPPNEDDKIGLRRVVADYLPDDLPAAPAYAQVGLILAATAMVGVQIRMNEQNSAYPIVVGQGFQVDFRDHPLLGLVGVYSRYVTRRDSSKRSQFKPEQLAMVMEYGRGRFKTIRLNGDSETLDMLKLSTRNQLMKALMGFETTERYRFPEPFITGLESVFEDCIPISRLLLAATPERVPLLFPRSAFTTKIPLSAIAVLGSFWSSVQLTEFKGWDVSMDLGFWNAPTWSRFIWETSVTRYEAISSDAGSFKGHFLVLQMCVGLLHSPKKLQAWFRGLRDDDQNSIKESILGQLKEIDRWITSSTQSQRDGTPAQSPSPSPPNEDITQAQSSSKMPPEFGRRIASIYRTTIILSQAHQLVTFRSQVRVKGQDTSQQKNYPSGSACHRHNNMLADIRSLLQDFKGPKEKLDGFDEEYRRLPIERGITQQTEKGKENGKGAENHGNEVGEGEKQNEEKRVPKTGAQPCDRERDDKDRKETQAKGKGTAPGKGVDRANQTKELPTKDKEENQTEQIITKEGEGSAQKDKEEQGKWEDDGQGEGDVKEEGSSEVKTEKETESKADNFPIHVKNRPHLGELFEKCKKYRGYLRFIAGFDITQHSIDDLCKILDELGAISVYCTTSEDDGADRRGDLNDILIYRCLAMALLFQTSIDTDKMTHLWDQVLPLI